jgi:hypothetical protein
MLAKAVIRPWGWVIERVIGATTDRAIGCLLVIKGCRGGRGIPG